MPGFDGTGPRGMGPMTGGGRGFCAIPLAVIGRDTWEEEPIPRTVCPGVCLTTERDRLLQVLCRLLLK